MDHIGRVPFLNGYQALGVRSFDPGSDGCAHAPLDAVKRNSCAAGTASLKTPAIPIDL